MWKKLLVSVTMVVSLTVNAGAQVLDGSIAGDNYSLLSLQTVQTGFGDANPFNGSELNAAWGRASGGYLRLTLTGNLEANFNKLNIFIDSVAGGQNVIDAGSNPTNDGWAARYDGFTFDSGFSADYLMIARNGNFMGDRFDFDFNSVGNLSVEEISSNIFGGSTQGVNASVGASGIGVAFNNTNTGGVPGGTMLLSPAEMAAAAAVQTGLELFIPLAAIGNPGVGDEIRIAAHINASNHDFLSNQFLGGFLTDQGNLGGDGFGNFTGNVGQVNLNNFLGSQYFTITVVPEPSAGGLLAIAGLVFARRRRS